MGFFRYLKKQFIPGYDLINTVEHIADKGVVDGIKSKIKEDVCEDMPVTSHIYKKGQFDGKKIGVKEASAKYEKKLLKQAELFLKEKEIAEKEIKAYRTLLDEYEKEIERLENKEKRTKKENEYLLQLLSVERQLKKMAIENKMRKNNSVTRKVDNKKTNTLTPKSAIDKTVSIKKKKEAIRETVSKAKVGNSVKKRNAPAKRRSTNI